MKLVTEKLDMIASERRQFQLHEMAAQPQSNYSATRETCSVLNEPERAYGRDKEKEKIVDILVNQVCDSDQLSVLPIIGIGGLGKTTLARLVFNDNKVVSHFDQKIWVCVSDNFDLRTLIKRMIESATKEECSSNLILEASQHRLRELLNRKRYLIVFDDVWNDDQESWYELRKAIACGSRGSVVVLTTRMKKVAELTLTLPAHELQGLPHEHCWSLFKERVFGRETEEYPDLEPIGEQIVKKCRGVPLAARALGGLLRFKREKRDWIHVQNSEIWNLEETLLLPSLRLSYHHLPLRLRRCFAYCSVFTKGREIDKEELIFRWIAHGYISSNGEEEDIGNDIWSELVLRSLFQDVEIYKGRTTFTMHDLVHDLARSVMENKVPGIQAKDDGKSASKGKIRQVILREHHVAFPSSIQPEIDLSFSLTNLSSLRMLDASWTGLYNLASTIGNLKHLRSLNLSHTDIPELPNAICSLWNLKILNLNCCRHLVRLPKRLIFLKKLRHLLLENCDSMIETPPKIGELSCLRTLSLFFVGHEKGNEPGELQGLNLGGKLEIRHLERVKNHTDAKIKYLCGKVDLCELTIKWERDGESITGENMDENVLEALEPHPNLEILRISGFSGRYFPRWLRNPNLVNLVQFELWSCRNCPNLSFPQLGDLPSIKNMVLSGVEGEYMIEDGSQVTTKFPSLEQLRLYNLPHLKGFVKDEAFDIFPRLQELYIEKCYSLILSPLPLLKEQMDKGSTLKFKPSLGNINILQISNGGFPNKLLRNLTDLIKTLTFSGLTETTLSVQGLKSLESFEIWGGERLGCIPHGLFPHLTTLKQLVINCCPELALLPEDIGYLKSLTYLQLSYLPKMISLPESLKHLTSLEKACIRGLPQLTSLPHSIKEMRNLQSLTIWDCPELAELPEDVAFLKSLTSLTLFDLPKMISLPETPTSLQDLDLYKLHRLTSLPHCIKEMRKLCSLQIRECLELAELPEDIGYLKSLTSLTLYDLPKMISLPESLKHLTSLEKLIIRELPQLTSLSRRIKEMRNLQSLLIRECPELAELPEDIAYLKSLTSLRLFGLPKMISLPESLKHLTSLENLSISYLEQLTSLPHCIKEMRNLQSLLIWNCPNVKRQCEKERGEDWHKIAHIPRLDM